MIGIHRMCVLETLESGDHGLVPWSWEGQSCSNKMSHSAKL